MVSEENKKRSEKLGKTFLKSLNESAKGKPTFEEKLAEEQAKKK